MNSSSCSLFPLPSSLSHKGFTLIEMLVVIGILAILIAASLGSYNAFIRKASRARCTELVSNVQTALEAVMQKEKAWPRAILAAGGSGNGEMTKETGAALAKRNALSLSYRKVEQEDGSTRYELTGNDRCGIVSPWALDVLKRNPSAGDGTAVPSGGTIADHRLRFAVDADYDGLTDVQLSASGKGSARVRASACVWCCGYDGKFGTKDDVYSWSKDQEER